jgi:PTH1 family peptidyl-tRNA hydrolase
MRLFVGLGNPGAKYAGNRHNVGFMAIDRIAADHGFPAFRSRFQGEVSEGRLGIERVVLLKPSTFMNLSGQSVGEAMRYFNLAPGKVRLKSGGGHAGHNGLRSLHAHIGEAYVRVRIGIGHPGHKDRVSGYVLSDFAKAEEPMLDDLLSGLSEGAAALAGDDGPRFLNMVAARIQPPRNKAAPAADAVPTTTADAPEPSAAKTLPSLLQRLADRFR